MAVLMASVLDADWNDLENEVRMVDEAGIDGFSLDIMDGKFVERTTFDIDTVKRIRRATERPIEAHLMVESPENWMKDICDAGVDQLLFHIEATDKPMEILDYVQGRHLSCGIAVLIETPIESLPAEVMKRVDIVNLMAVRVGYGGQKASEQTVERIRQLRDIFGSLNGHFAIGVDGGMKIDNCRTFSEAGADLILMGTGIYHASDRAEAVRTARENIQSDDPESRERLRVFFEKNHLLNDNGEKKCTD
ncbi:MAG: ribulose-phosphate 3-epimerase [Eubacteriales bacterium]|nr:ribulose-phosphate 3-epimerase [Eubacteriales bacterium]